MDFKITPSGLQGARIAVPGDKSISHRAVLLGAIAEGDSEIEGFLPGEDCLATLAAMRALGVRIERPATTRLHIEGVGLHGLQAPAQALDMGNSGTAMRLLAGILAGQTFTSELTGDASLSRRPMGRIIAPLESMGAQIDSNEGRPPLRIVGSAGLKAIDYALPVASAQVKSAVLLAGLYAEGVTRVVEPAVTRDHTERMLRAMGAEVTAANGAISVAGGQHLQGISLAVPGDLSSAAFPMLGALLAESADLLLENIGINPTRTGVIEILRAMGGDITLEAERDCGAEPVADIRVRSSRLRGCAVDPALVSLAIDEFPLLFAAAAAAEGVTTFAGIGELRVKESDRIAAIATGLRGLGIEVDESPDGAVVHGGRLTGGVVESFDDHRIAMALAMAATAAQDEVTIRGVDNVNTSFPGFAALLRSVGGRIEEVEE